MNSGNRLFRFNDGFSADYLFEDGLLYRYVGDGEGWEWDEISEVPWRFHDNSFIVAIDMSFMKVDQNHLVEAVAVIQDQDWGYQDSTGVLRFVSKMNRYSTKEETNNALFATGNARELNATVGLSSIRVEISAGQPVDSYRQYGLFVDTDGIDAGYQYYNITASHLILNDRLYRYKGDGRGWEWQFVKDCPPKRSERTLIYTVDHRDIGFTEGSAELIGAFQDAFTGEIQATQTLQVLRNYPAITPISY